MKAEPHAPAATARILVMAQVLEDFDSMTEKERANAPIAAVDCGESLDFGSFGPAETVTRQFTISNKGKSQLAIRRLWVPEGEGVTVSADHTEVKRGKTATVTVTVDAAALEEELLNVPLTLLCNDPETPRQTIRLVGIIDKKQH